ncbi:hypothetical protein PR202_gb27944 [Eleusine coracana subsp. coracana]|uniref:Uncharacterized protein n=1 Tax=Eleusine coracana subsp. coracana TaxID=191504 RepID=A0AAV5FXG5_ELECO|nr:hypothetical protein PR202_gb27944 [Eleusine coracana subsp. coracana]
MATVLVGPPIIRGARPTPPPDETDAAGSHPFLALFDAGFNDPDAAKDDKPKLARTANDSATYANSGNPCVDLFFQAVPNTPAERVRDLVAAAWARDPLTALKLVANLRGVRGTGKSDREGFYAAALWMHDHHPRTLACNVPALAAFGYLKDFPELLFRLIHGAEVRKVARARVDADKARKKVRVMMAARVARFRSGRGGAAARASHAPPPKPTLADYFSAAIVTGKAKGRYKALFKKHDEARFGKYLEDVVAGKAKIAAGALLPHEIAAPAYRGEDDAVAELQWRRMVDDLRAKGALRNCVAVCDVSGSMSGQPMEVCVALGVLVAELSEAPWSGRVITFSSRPEIHEVRGETLREKMRFVKTMDWGANTNFQAVFDRILETAVAARLAPEKMVRTVFVFSDMEFDQAGGRRWETDYQIVFWNLADSKTTPVTSTQPGVALVSGFSKNLMKLFLENDGVLNPEVVMAACRVPEACRVRLIDRLP